MILNHSSYGLAFGPKNEKPYLSALNDAQLQAEKVRRRSCPLSQEEFHLTHCDNVKRPGLVPHLKTPNYWIFNLVGTVLALRKERRKETANTAKKEEQAWPIFQTASILSNNGRHAWPIKDGYNSLSWPSKAQRHIRRAYTWKPGDSRVPSPFCGVKCPSLNGWEPADSARPR